METEVLKKISHTATLSPQIPRGLKPVLPDKRPVLNCMSHGTISCTFMHPCQQRATIMVTTA